MNGKTDISNRTQVNLGVSVLAAPGGPGGQEPIRWRVEMKLLRLSFFCRSPQRR